MKELLQTNGFIGFNDTSVWDLEDSLKTICEKVCDNYYVNIDDELCRAIMTNNIVNLSGIKSSLGFMIVDVEEITN
jgi:hypothetical protein